MGCSILGQVSPQRKWRSVTSQHLQLLMTYLCVQVGIADFLICVEMVFAAVAHYFVFGHQEHQSGFYQLADEDDASQGSCDTI